MVAYRIGIDVGGTFTDFVAVPDGGSPLLRHKVASTPADPSQAVEEGMRTLLAEIGAGNTISSVTHGMTIGLNAIIQRRGGRVVLVVTEGFPDLLEIGRSRMPSSFDLHAVNQRPLVSRDHVLQVSARLDATGNPLTEVTEDEVARLADRIVDLAPETVVLNLVNGYANPRYEEDLASRVEQAVAARSATRIEVISAATVWPEIREYERTLVAVMGAHIHGIVKTYLLRLRDRLARLGITAPLFISASNGGTLTVDSAIARPLDTVLSGPASGVTAARLHYPGENLITLDMGGTSSDISIIVSGQSELTTDTEIGGLALMLPVVDVSAIGAGGGSVIWADTATTPAVLQVGPDSAGASPGPASYGLGGDRPAVTDAYLVTGMISPDGFLGGRMRLHPEKADAALSEVAGQLAITGAQRAVEVASSALRLTTAQMATELQKLMAEKAVDPREFTIVPFGGAGPTHAAMLAEELGVSRLRIPDAAATFCALGAAMAPLRRDFVHSVRALLDDDVAAQIELAAAEIIQAGRGWLAESGDDPDRGSAQISLDMRYPGQAYELSVKLGSRPLAGSVAHELSVREITAAFDAEHVRRYGFVHARADLEVGTLRVAVVGATSAHPVLSAALADNTDAPAPPAPTPNEHRRVQWRGEWLEAAVYDHEAIPAGASVTGYAIIEHQDTTIVAPPGWTATRLTNLDLELTRDDTL